MTANTKPTTRIVQRGDNHSYLLDGEKVPGVTTILGAGVPKPWLAPWTAKMIAEYVMDRLTPNGDHVYADELLADLRVHNDTNLKYPKKLEGFSRITFAEILKSVQYGPRDEAGKRGTEVHKLAERLSRGDEIDVPDELAGHVESYVRFLDGWQPTNALIERVVINRRWGYMGKFDIIADFPVTPVHDPTTHEWKLISEPSTALLDVKTGKAAYNDVVAQLAGYRFAETMLTEDGLDEEPMPEVDWCGVIWVRADGYDVYTYLADATAFRMFVYMKYVVDYFADNGPIASVRSEALAAPVTEAVAS